ncbi:family 10 glycosylhydrolase [Pseudanabaena galeata UHCC 0370]|uniref:Family 10 glycosylhydrolase n=1 Tax=Pseudanabaena galeata UHCC 0370 TaxID=3110310 RepID=A0ABU5TKU0_9CYAN|nr:MULTISPECIES: family 10 glycosylhydrolase [Pseudanabaena]MEA5478889.1 family 10 glycosylhydrolase [Pseudanabaena galeata UHCC 0370]MEA5485662.1 family 10 glycosylhydrolase [Pseudanabaena sp. CCNP1317]WGS72006.1 family 10 glycosylhydrolase [Pseudanabaena galeata CCNP1313]
MMINFPFWAVAQTPNGNANITASNTIDQSPPPTQPQIRPSNVNELRGIWLTNVDSEVLFSTQSLERAIKRLKRLNFNTLYPTVWNRGYTLYPSKVAKDKFGVDVFPISGLQERDMLAETIKFGHEQGFAVIPWFEYGLMTEESSELMRQHPDWITQRRDGSHLFLHGEKDQHRLAWLNPARPEVQKFLTDLIVEVVTKYDVDGIQLDDHFGMPVELGYDDYTIALYKKDHFGRLPPEDFNDPSWMKWRAKYVTNLMRKISRAVKAIKPNCLVSLSPNPKEFSYKKFLQDWYSWVYLNYIDELIVQVYRDNIGNFTTELSRPELQEIRQKIPVAVGILTGLRVQNVDMRQIKGQVRVAREMNLDGFSFFFYETLGNRDASFETLFFTPAIRPDLRNIASN